jgi:hypothetical protein
LLLLLYYITRHRDSCWTSILDVCSYFIYVYWCLLLFAAGVIDMFGHKRYSQFIYGMNLIIGISFFFQITRIFTCYKEYLPVTNPTAQNKTRMGSFIFIESCIHIFLWYLPCSSVLVIVIVLYYQTQGFLLNIDSMKMKLPILVLFCAVGFVTGKYSYFIYVYWCLLLFYIRVLMSAPILYTCIDVCSYFISMYWCLLLFIFTCRVCIF